MLWRRLDGWRRWLLSRRTVVPGQLAPARERRFFEEPSCEAEEIWVWEAKFSVSRRLRKEQTFNARSPREENRRMPTALSVEERAVLRVLETAYPKALHLHDLSHSVQPEMGRPVLLQTVDGLLVRGLVEGRPLRGAGGLEDAANLRVTATGRESLQGAVPSVPAGPRKGLVQASVLNVLIASPSDVQAERDAVESAILEWNASHFPQTGLILRPVRWETSFYPASGGRPQGLLNPQIVEDAHFVIGIFGSRLGMPTGKAESGTLEEIEQFLATRRHVALYFSNAPVARSADRTQLDALEAYQRKRQKDSLYATFGSVEELRRQVVAHLPRIVASIQKGFESEPSREEPPGGPITPTRTPRRRKAVVRPMGIEEIGELSPKEMELLWNAAKDPDGELLHSETLDGEDLRSNGKHFLAEADRRTAAEWIGALRNLDNKALIEALGEDRDFFQVTAEGYAVADHLQDFCQWEARTATVRAYYMNAEPQELVIPCRRIVSLPATYYSDQIGADRSVMRSVKDRRSLLLEGVAEPNMDWEPTDVEFTDEESGKTIEFRVDEMMYLRPGTLKLSITG